MHSSVVVAVLVLLSSSSAVHADDRRAYVGGGFMLSTWRGRESPELSASLRELNSTGATVPGVLLEGGKFLRPAIAVGGELVVPGRHEWMQVSHYLINPGQRQIRYRDVTLTAMARLQRPAGTIRAGLVGGFELVLQDSLQRGAGGHVGPGGEITFDPLGDERRITGWTTGAVLGGDALLAITERLAIVPEVRLHLILREGVLGSSVGRLNVAGVVIRAGVGLRATF